MWPQCTRMRIVKTKNTPKIFINVVHLASDPNAKEVQLHSHFSLTQVLAH